jgi:hypothetical protein
MNIYNYNIREIAFIYIIIIIIIIIINFMVDIAFLKKEN